MHELSLCACARQPQETGLTPLLVLGDNPGSVTKTQERP